EIPNRLARVRRLFRLLHGLLKFLLEEVGGMPLGLDRLLEDGLAPAVLLPHGLAAASMSLKVFGFTAAVWAMTARVSTSILSTALQHGHVTSKLGEFFAIERIIPQSGPRRREEAFRNRDASLYVFCCTYCFPRRNSVKNSAIALFSVL